MIVPTEAHHELKVPVIIRPGDYTVLFERTSGLTFIHCDVVGRWSRSLKDRLRRDFDQLKALHASEPIHALHHPGDRKHEKFLKLFGFRLSASFTGPDGDPLQIYAI